MGKHHEKRLREAAQALASALDGLYWRAQSRAHAGHREPIADPVWEAKVNRAYERLRVVLGR